MSTVSMPHASVDITPGVDGRGGELRAQQWLPARVAEVFPFFQNPYNLERITPPFLRFHVLRSSTPEIARDTRLWYRLSLHGVPVWWRTRIAVWAPPHRFVDLQERGPYRRWHHTHEFVEAAGGTLMRDTVVYELRLGRLMPRAVARWVERDVRGIFEYRQRAIEALFGASSSGRAAEPYSVRRASTGSMPAARRAGK